MLSTTQLLAQRVPPPSRTKPRWQPYTATRSPLSMCLITPKPSLSSPLHTPNPSSDSSQRRPQISQIPKDPLQRDASKQKFAVGLIDQTVKTLSEIWPPQDIPRIFTTPTKSSPLSDSQSSSAQLLLATGNDSGTSLVSLRTFVHEVLRRSRTSGSVLQTALCYLEAVRPKIPGIIRDEKIGVMSCFQPEYRILPATEAELALDRELSANDAYVQESIPADDLMKTVRVETSDSFISNEEDDSSSLIVEPAMSAVQASSSLPSPLLCPRRAFLAAIILASKFSQDKCYSNRAWAKLSGLPAREIGRCERALGQTLEWRLWVGKSISSPLPSRPVVRSQSEGSIAFSPLPSSSGFLSSSNMAPTPLADAVPTANRVHRGLRKSSTLPARGFAFQGSDGLSSAFTHDVPIEVDQNRQSYSSPPPCHIPVPSSSSDGSSSSSSSESGSSPSTPGLTYSPANTESSLGDRTVDGPFPAFNPWFKSADLVLLAAAASKARPASGQPDVADHLSFDGARRSSNLKADLSDPGMCLGTPMAGTPYLWHAEGDHMRMFEPTSVY